MYLYCGESRGSDGRHRKVWTKDKKKVGCGSREWNINRGDDFEMSRNQICMIYVYIWEYF